MKFLADMGISPNTGRALQDLGYDAEHLGFQGLALLEDPVILDKARAEGRVLLTHDLDFGDLMAASGEHLPSVIIFRLRNMRPDRVTAHLREILAQHEQALEQGVIISVTEGQLRLRRLPIE